MVISQSYYISQVVGDLAQVMVSNKLSKEDVLSKADSLNLPTSVIQFLQVSNHIILIITVFKLIFRYCCYFHYLQIIVLLRLQGSAFCSEISLNMNITQGYLGTPEGGFPEPFRTTALKGAPLVTGRPGESLEPLDLAKIKEELVEKYGSWITDRYLHNI